MSPRPDLPVVLPGIVAGMLLALVSLEVCDAIFPAILEQLFPPKVLLLVAASVAVASVAGIISLYLCPGGTREK